MNKVQKKLRDKYLSEKMKEPKTLNLTEYEDRKKLYEWATKQKWWEKTDFIRYLGKHKNLENAIYHYLKDKDDKTKMKGIPF